MARLATYLGTAAAVPVLRRRLEPSPEGVRLPGGPTIPIAAGALSLAFAASASSKQLLAAAAALGLGVVIFLLRRRQA